MIFERIKNLREDNDLTQTELATMLNIWQWAYSYYETGSHDIPVGILIRLAEIYEWSVDYLLERTDSKEINK